MGTIQYKQIRTTYITCNYKGLSLCFFRVSITVLRIHFPESKKYFIILQSLYFLQKDQLWTKEDIFRTLMSRRVVDSLPQRAKETVECEGSC